MHPTWKHLIKYQKVYLLILLILVLTLPNILRWTDNNSSVIGGSSYYALNIVKEIETPMFYGNPYLTLLSLNTTHQMYIYKIIPLLLGILSFWLLMCNLKKLGLSPKNQFFLLAFLILSPAFIYAFTVLNHYSLVFFITLLGFHLTIHKNRILHHLSLPLFLIIPFFDIFSGIFTLLLLGAYHYIRQGKKNFIDSPAKLPAIVVIISLLFNIKKSFLLGPYHSQETIINFFSDLGGLFGISLFIILLALIGILATWKKEKFFLNYFFLGLLILISIYQTSMVMYLNFFVVSLAALGINYLLERDWKIKLIKNLTIFLLLLGVLFSGLSSIDSLAQLPPNNKIITSLNYMRENTPSYNLVFSHPQDSYLVEYYSGRPAFIHYHDLDFRKREKIVQQALNSTYIEETFPLFKFNDISHIYFSPQVTVDLPTERGLLFLLQNEKFKKIYSHEGIEIWEFE